MVQQFRLNLHGTGEPVYRACHLTGKTFGPFLKVDAVFPILFVRSSEACLAFDNELYGAIQFFWNHASLLRVVNAKGAVNLTQGHLYSEAILRMLCR